MEGDKVMRILKNLHEYYSLEKIKLTITIIRLLVENSEVEMPGEYDKDSNNDGNNSETTDRYNWKVGYILIYSPQRRKVYISRAGKITNYVNPI